MAIYAGEDGNHIANDAIADAPLSTCRFTLNIIDSYNTSGDGIELLIKDDLDSRS